MNDYKPLETAIIELLRNYPWYGQLIAGMDKKLTDKVPLAAVKVTSRIELLINPLEFNRLPLKFQIGILLHECYHIIHGHVARAKKVSKSFNKALNIAADRAINEHIHYMTKNNNVVAVIPDKFTDSTGKEMKPVTKKNFQDNYPDKEIKDNQDMEYYYNFLKENSEEGDGEGDFGGDMDTLDSHDQWEEGNGNEEVTKEIIKKAMEKATDKAQGRIPSDVLAKLEELRRSTVSWQSILQRFVAKCTETNIDSSRKRINRRYGLVHPGTIKEPKLRLGVAIDSSGSVSDAYLTQFISELSRIYSLGIEIFVVIADADINAMFEFDPNKKIEVKGRGGTAFQPAIDKLQKDASVDAIVYMTDGESSEDLVVKKPILWALCPSYTIPKGYTEKQCIKIADVKK